MKQHQNQPHKKNFPQDAEDTNRVSDPGHASSSDEKNKTIKDDEGENRMKKDQHSTKFSPTKRIRPLL